MTSTWRADEMTPFAELIASGHADAIMSAHVSHRLFDSRHPLSLSPEFLRRTLREGLDYDGILISDALDMGALTRFYSREEIAVMSLLAGHDLLVFSHDSRLPGAEKPTEQDDDNPAEALHRRIVRAFAEALSTGRMQDDVLYGAATRARRFAQYSAQPR